MQLSPLGFVACQSKNCTNKIECTIMLIGALETSAPPEKNRPQAQSSLWAICGIYTL
ncbi:hypothetical protein HMPREF0673_02311 [Leyella stercorea DSM 18206]|uniref:Uncharacterized protein n=1 Tax=Leyella stercorea DSM 18206 TaxID=1002367 RepID=G6B093_9BACT|nr:hypothetical protein HMPREF0673_02311 [Leyella stercorea DSM 18206]